MVDRLKTAEPVSKGTRGVCIDPDTKDRSCMRQIAKLQYHYCHTSELILLSIVLSATQGIRRSLGLQSMLHLRPRTLAQPHTGVRSVFCGSDGR